MLISLCLTHTYTSLSFIKIFNMLQLCSLAFVTVAGEIVAFKSIAAYYGGLNINTNVTKKDAEEGLTQVLTGQQSLQIGLNMICFSVFLISHLILHFQLVSLSSQQTKIFLTTSSCLVQNLLNPMTCQCRYTQGNGWLFNSMRFLHTLVAKYFWGIYTKKLSNYYSVKYI